jgi:hypothetical protein
LQNFSISKRKWKDATSHCEKFSDYPNPSLRTKEMSPDKVLEYASAVLSDGLLLLEFRDVVHEGNGERVMRCWRLMLLYFFHSGHRKYTRSLLAAGINQWICE